MGPHQPKYNKTSLVFTHGTIPTSVKEIRPTVSEIQMLTERQTDRRKVTTVGHLAKNANTFFTYH